MINQPMIRTFLNAHGSVTLVYGSSDQDETQSLDLEMMAIAKCDIAAVAKALIKLAKEE